MPVRLDHLYSQSTARMLCSVMLLGSTVAGCAAHSSANSAASSLSAASAPAADTAWFAGKIAYTLPTGREVGQVGILVERRVQPTLALITEIVTTQSRQPGAPPDRFEVHQQVDAANARFTMREVAGAFEGDGSLSGDRWRWRSWQSTSRLPDGSRVESVDSLVGDTRQLRVHKRVLGADGAVRITTVESLSSISRTGYDSLQAVWRSGH